MNAKFHTLPLFPFRGGPGGIMPPGGVQGQSPWPPEAHYVAA